MKLTQTGSSDCCGPGLACASEANPNLEADGAALFAIPVALGGIPASRNL
jgi:hypothetical protein